MDKLKLAISSCPNDTFIFGGIIRKDIDIFFDFSLTMEDINLCNNMAINEEQDIIKVSFGVFPKIKNNYKILKCGGALGFGCGPILLSKNYKSVEELKDKKIAIPGENTTAFMVMKRFYPEYTNNIEVMCFNKIMPAIASGLVDAGLVIHEGRFTYHKYNLIKIIDLGEKWEEKYKLPIPLGFIALHNKYLRLSDVINEVIKNSIDFAYSNKEKAIEFCKKYAQDMDNDVINSHIDLYVNKYSKDLSPAIAAISVLIDADESVFI